MIDANYAIQWMVENRGAPLPKNLAHVLADEVKRLREENSKLTNIISAQIERAGNERTIPRQD